jgi:hypothetical protein
MARAAAAVVHDEELKPADHEFLEKRLVDKFSRRRE